MSTKPGIPALSSKDGSVTRAMKEVLEHITGARGGRLTSLQTTATLPQVISKVNEIIDRLNA